MPKFYCDYCQVYLTHDSPSVRKSHGQGWKHRMQVQNYYASIDPANVQAVMDGIINAYANYDPSTDPTMNAQQLADISVYSPPMAMPSALVAPPQMMAGPAPVVGNPHLPPGGVMPPPGIRPPPPGWIPPQGYPLLPTMMGIA